MVRMLVAYCLFFVVMLLYSCEFSWQLGDSKEEQSGDGKNYKPVKKEGALLYNGINLVSRGVQVEKAFLVTDEEEAVRIGEDNFVDFKRGVKMALYTGEGWKDVNGKVRI